MPFLLQPAQFDGQLGLQVFEQPVGVAAQHVLHLQLPRHVLLDGDQAGRHAQFAIGEGVQGVDGLLGEHATRQLDFDLDLLGGVVVDRGDLEFVRLGRLLDGLDERLGGDGGRQLGDDNGARVRLGQAHPAADAAVAVVVVGDVDDAAAREIRVEDKLPAAQVVDLGLEQLAEVVRHDLGGHAHGDALGAEQQQQRDLGRQPHRLLHAAVVGVDELGQVLVEQGLARQRRQPALDVTGRRGLVTGEDVAVVALAVDQVVLVGQVDERVEDRLVAVRVQLHGFADHVGHLVEAAVVHVGERLQDAPLHRLEAVVGVRDGPLADDVGGVVEEIGVEQLVQLAALALAGLAHTGLTIRWSMMYCFRSGVFLPM